MPLLLSVFAAGGMLIGYNLQQPPPLPSDSDDGTTISEGYSNFGAGRVEEVLRYIDGKYVDKVDRDELVEKAIDNLLDELDPHSNYITSEEISSVRENLDGEFVGIGVEYEIVEDTILVLSVVKDGPSDIAGIKSGDRIITVSDSLVAGVKIDAEGVGKHLRGDVGSEVVIGIKRVGESSLVSKTIKRGRIPLPSVANVSMLDNKTGYIKILRFSATTYKEFMDSMEELSKMGMKDLVIDLRQNPGGYLKEATRMLNQLILQRDVLLVYTEGEHSSKKTYNTSGPLRYDIDDLAILIDENSASASEIMAGAIQDWDRGLIIGRRSFGKGLVQEQYDLSDGSALRLTVSRYYTKSGRLIQKSYEDHEDYRNDAEDRLAMGELTHQDSVFVADSTEYRTVNGRLVYGGGGIIPDIFVPMDKVYQNKTYQKADDYISRFIYPFADKRRDALTEMGMDNFARNYQLSDEDFDAFKEIVIASTNGISEEDLDGLSFELKLRIKSGIGKYVFGPEAFYKVWNKHDSVIKKTLSVLDKSEAYLESE